MAASKKMSMPASKKVASVAKAGKKMIDDAKITMEVKSKLMMEKSLPLGKISVETIKGVVCLRGSLTSEDQASTAVQLAGSVDGVKDVDASKLDVEGGQQPLTDSYITAKVKGAFLREKLFGDKPIAVMDVKVETKDGVVYLSGEVDDQKIAKNAVDLAKEIDGVKNVESNIKVK